MVDQASLAATDANIPKGPLDGIPAVPAADTPVTNNTGMNVMVRLNAGTVTSIKVDGVTVLGVTTGEWVPLRNRSTIQWAGSVAPTGWQWWPWN